VLVVVLALVLVAVADVSPRDALAAGDDAWGDASIGALRQPAARGHS
jgi:hypothetical protein